MSRNLGSLQFLTMKKKTKKTKKKKVIEERKISKKAQIKTENKIIRNFLIGIVVLALVIFLIYLFFQAMSSFEYQGVKFKIVKEGDLIFYNTKFPLVNQDGDHTADYNFYIRKDPRDLGEIGFEGDLLFAKTLVLQSEESFNCDGDGIIAVANLVQLYQVLGIKVIKDENATCDSLGAYTLVRLKLGNETKIEKFGTSCYDIYINECEILEATERFMLETFIKINE